MAKIRLILPDDPKLWWWLFWLHVPAGRDRTYAYHKLWCWDYWHYPMQATGAFVLYPEARAWATARLWSSLPRVLQDKCPLCQPYGRPSYPRYNIYRGEEHAPYLPAHVEEWVWAP